MEKGVTWLLTVIITLVTIVLLVLYRDSGGRVTDAGGAESFQAAVGGMGMGAVTVPSWNFGDFDPRLQPGGYDRSYPIPGGYSYSPDRLTMVSSFQD
ncbi:MAG: hypothetical protein ABFR63_09970 [Thermodesulfobacteriota bacterium]